MKIWLHLSAILIVALGFANQPNAQTLPGGAEPGRIPERFDRPAAPTAQARAVRGLESTVPPAEAASIQLMLEDVRVVGSSVYLEGDLDKLYSDKLGKLVSLAEVFEIAASITAKYGQDGYVLSRAIVPPQALNPKGASVQIQVVEGYVDDVRWPSGARVNPTFLAQYESKILADRPLNVKTLERYLLLANDIPGSRFESNLVASASTPGASTLIVTVEEERASGFVSIDNHGVEASGPVQVTLNGTFNNYLGWSERIETEIVFAGPSESNGTELSFFSIGYYQVLNAEGLAFFADANVSRGEPGTNALAALNFETEGQNVSFGLTYPFIRQRDQSLIGTIAFDWRDSKSSSLGLPASEDRLRILRLEIDYENADARGGQNQVGLSFSRGINGLGSTANTNPLASRIPGFAEFSKLTLDLARTQQLGNGYTLFGNVFGQWASDPLLSSQECGFGGRTFGVGFDSSIITGDTCAMASIELRKTTQPPASLGDWLDYTQFFGVLDYGKIWNKNAPLGTPSDDKAASAGLGIRFGSREFSAEVAVTTTLSTPQSQPNVDDTRGWLKVTRNF